MTDQTPSENHPIDDDEPAVAPATPEDASEYAEIYGDEAADVAADEGANGADDSVEAKPEPVAAADAQPARGAGERIAKVMARAGVASRREAERMVIEGRVTVNGEKITSPALDIQPTDKVRIDGQPMDAPQETRLWMYYKPVGLVTSEADEKGRQTVFDALPRELPRVMSVGRLDLNSEGLLLLTNDGELKRRLELPSTGWLRRYRVRVNGQPTELTFGPLRRGAVIDGEEFQPMEITIDSQKGANAWLTVGIREGRNREIRRAMAHVGLTVNRLIRIAYGPFRLTGMEENEVREIKRRVLRDQLGGLMGDAGEDDPQPARRGAGPRGRAGEADGRGDRRPRPPRAEGEGFDRKPRAPRGEGFGDRKPRPPRAEGEGFDRKPRALRGEGFGDRKPRPPRAEGEGFDRKPRAPRGEGFGDRKPRPPRAEGEGFDRKPRAPRGEGFGDRKPRPPRAEGEGFDRKPRTPRGEGRFDRSGPGAGGPAKSEGQRGFRGKSDGAASRGDRPRPGGKPGFGGKPGGSQPRGPRPGGKGGPRRPRNQG